eukprot:TRINITY_DN10133_c0_g1_i3.p2 TRINITY_DN10133_c0_g1~~TRINITY_DN10133_c0_g1_i3.p2  ORF type:complete len:389 (+),score=53.11 TRINITY_DN10133_c0_g1_i3:8-1174(+)
MRNIRIALVLGVFLFLMLQGLTLARLWVPGLANDPRVHGVAEAFGSKDVCRWIADASYNPEPSNWKLRSTNEIPLRFSPSVGNGYLASTLNQEIYIAGLYNGPAVGGRGHVSHRARISFPEYWSAPIVLFHPKDGEQVLLQRTSWQETSVDLRNGTVHRRFCVEGPSGAVLVEQSWFAHRSQRHVLVRETKLQSFLQTAAKSAAELELRFETPDENLVEPSPIDVTFQEEEYSGSGVVFSGTTLHPEVEESVEDISSPLLTPRLVAIGLATNLPLRPVKVKVFPSSPIWIARHVIALVTDIPGDLGTDDPEAQPPHFHAAQELEAAAAEESMLLPTHSASWHALWSEATISFEIDEGAEPPNASGMNLQQIVHSSLFYILQSVRDDWP